jgi:hypothetical protein
LSGWGCNFVAVNEREFVIIAVHADPWISGFNAKAAKSS